LNSDDNPSLSGELGVTALPTVIAFNKGAKVGEPLVGFRAEPELNNFISQKFGITQGQPKKDPEQMSISELKQELQRVGKNPNAYLEKSEMINALKNV
jgi:thioredoxin-like negative regulator of GroEL